MVLVVGMRLGLGFGLGLGLALGLGLGLGLGLALGLVLGLFLGLGLDLNLIAGSVVYKRKANKLYKKRGRYRARFGGGVGSWSLSRLGSWPGSFSRSRSRSGSWPRSETGLGPSYGSSTGFRYRVRSYCGVGGV